MNIKLDEVSVKLINGLVKSSVDYWEAKLKVNEEYEDALKYFESINPILDLADALEMDTFEEIWPYIKAVLRKEITKDECTKRIVYDYEEFFTERLIKREERLESFFHDMNQDIKDQSFIMFKHGIIASVEQANRYTWNVNVYDVNDDDYAPNGLTKNNFKTKLEAMEYILQIGETHNIIEVKV